MKIRTRGILLVAIASFLAGCTMTEGEFNTGRQAIAGSPAVRKVTISDCVGRVRQQPAAEQKQTAALFNISLSRYPSTYCNRLINAYASGRITYKDYVALGSSTADNSKVIRIMQGR